MEELTKIREITQRLREMISDEELDVAQRSILWANIRQLEGLAKKFRSKKLSNRNRKDLRAALVRLAEDLLDVFRPKE